MLWMLKAWAWMVLQAKSQGMSSPAIMKDNKGASAMAANEITGCVIFVILAASQELVPLGKIF